MDLIVKTIAFLFKYIFSSGLTMNTRIIFYIFVSFLAGLIYLEILELNFCDLNKHLEKNIQIRAIIKNPELDLNENSTDSIE
jgi:hypothetical protein